jgi:hypothetical protein
MRTRKLLQRMTLETRWVVSYIEETLEADVHGNINRMVAFLGLYLITKRTIGFLYLGFLFFYFTHFIRKYI